MTKSAKQKGRILYLQQILLEYTDEEHGLTLGELSERLEALGMNAERKTLYDDLDALEQFGLDLIKMRKGNKTYYHVISRQFELPEIKLLIDAIEASKFVTREKSRALIAKIETLTSHYEAGQLNRHVFVANRVKTMNKGIYYVVDGIHDAISNNRQISFQLTQRVVDFKSSQKFCTCLRRDGKYYQISPWELTWNDGNYYLVGYDEESGELRHFRVDRMINLTMQDAPRKGGKTFEQFDVGAYAKKVFNMFGGKEYRVQIRFQNYLIDTVLERFGEDVYIRPDGEEHFIIAVDLFVSPQFYGWLCGLGTGAHLCGPAEVQQAYRSWLADSLNQYL